VASPATGEKSKYKLRRMRRTDIDQVFALEQIIFPTPWSLKSYEFELESNPASRQWVIETQELGDDWHIVAFSVCWILGDEVHIANFAVASAYRRRGLGHRLLRHILECAQEEGMHSATLEVRAGNQAAQGLYAAYGFQQVGLRKQYYSDNREDALLLQLPNLERASANWPAETK
jgi:ribosomal-protein-alanine N-acetyltransferase